MTSQEFSKRLVDMYGPFDGWVKVAQYVSSKVEGFRDALLEVLQEKRPREMGPPTINDLMDLAEDAAKKMDAKPVDSGGTVTWEMINSWPREEGARGDGWLSRRQAGEALALILGKVGGKVVK